MATPSAFSSPPSLSAPNPHSAITNSDSNSPTTASSGLNPNPNQSHSPSSSLLNLAFGHDHSFFSACTDRGLRVFSCDPFAEVYRRDGGGIGAADMLSRSNLLAVVGGGPNPQFSPNKVKLWCDVQGRFVGELACSSTVLAVRLRRDLIAVVMERKALVFNFEDLRILRVIETVANPKGLCAVSEWGWSAVLVFVGSRRGEVRIEHHASRRTKYIEAHESDIACLGLTQDGRFLATASTKGTLVRVFRTADGTLLQEVRRGVNKAEIHSLAFSSTSQWLAVSSDKGTVHVFSLKVNSENPGNVKSRNVLSYYTLAVTSLIPSLSSIKGVLPRYFSSEWSVAQFRLVESSRYIVAFGHMKNTIIILGMNGSFYRCQFDPVKGGEMSQLEHHNFLNSK